MYRIIYSQGEIAFEISSTTEGFKAQLIDSKNQIDVLLTGNNQDDVYDKCRCWASANIHGEFMFLGVADQTEISAAA